MLFGTSKYGMKPLTVLRLLYFVVFIMLRLGLGKAVLEPDDYCMKEHNKFSKDIGFYDGDENGVSFICKKDGSTDDVDSAIEKDHVCFLMRWYCTDKCTHGGSSRCKMTEITLIPKAQTSPTAITPQNLTCICIPKNIEAVYCGAHYEVDWAKLDEEFMGRCPTSEGRNFGKTEMATPDCIKNHKDLSANIEFMANCKKGGNEDIDSEDKDKHECFMMRRYCAMECSKSAYGEMCDVESIFTLNIKLDSNGNYETLDCVCTYNSYTKGCHNTYQIQWKTVLTEFSKECSSTGE